METLNLQHEPVIDDDGYIQIGVTEQFAQIAESNKRIILLEGGTRSGKTYALAQNFIKKLKDPAFPRTLEIVRKTMPSLKATAMVDFFDILKMTDVYNRRNHNKTDHIYIDGKNQVQFLALDSEQKIRGRKRFDLWINEANELAYEEYAQLAFRTEGQIYMDLNPVDEDHWIVQKILTRDDVLYIKTTYQDNPFLKEEIVREIEELQKADEQYWKVFGLGERPVKGAKIYTHYNLVDEFNIDDFDDVFYGIDFGWNVASSIVRVGVKDNAYTWDELFYRTNVTNPELIEVMKGFAEQGLISKTMNGYADAAEPDRIDEMVKAGFNVVKADKSVSSKGNKNPVGIDFVKSRPLNITKGSTNLLWESGRYMYKTMPDGTITDEPVKVNDHALDAARYAEYTYGKELTIGRPSIRIL